MGQIKTAMGLLQKPNEFRQALALKMSRTAAFHKLSDKSYLKLLYRLYMGKKLNLKDPSSFNEKLQWLKLYDHKPEYIQMVDKYWVRDYIAERIGKKYLIPLLGLWEQFEEIDFDKLPNQFVLKCNHDSGSVVICKDKASFDMEAAREKLTRGLKNNLFYFGREWPYKDVKPYIIAEKLMQDSTTTTDEGLTDYKFFCFNGIVDSVMLCLDRHLHNAKFYFFDKNWDLKRFNIRGKNAPADFTLQKPKTMDRMFEIAHELSKEIPFIRVDLYECDEQIYFGELTFFPASGFDSNLLAETDEYFGHMINLPIIKNGTLNLQFTKGDK